MIPDGFIIAMFIAFVMVNGYNVVQTLVTRTTTQDRDALKLLRSVGIVHLFWGIERVMFIFIAATSVRYEWVVAIRSLINDYGLWRYMELALFAAMIYSTVLFWESISPKEPMEDDCDEPK